MELHAKTLNTIRCRANDTAWGNNLWLVIRVARERIVVVNCGHGTRIHIFPRELFLHDRGQVEAGRGERGKGLISSAIELLIISSIEG